MAERNHSLIDGKLFRYMLSSVLILMAMQLNNVVDTLLVGNLIDTNAMSAIRLCLPVISLEQIPGYGLCAGGAVCAGVMLGQRDNEGASRIFSVLFWLTLAVGLLFTVMAFFLAHPLGSLLAGGGELAGPVSEYLFIWMLGAPVMGAGLCMASFMGAVGRPKLSSAYIIISNVINLILDYVLIVVIPLGIRGSGLASMLGFLLAMPVFLIYTKSNDRKLVLGLPKSLTPVLDAVKAAPLTLLMMVMGMVGTLGSNSIVLGFLGTEGITVYTVCSNVLAVMLMVAGAVIGVIPNLVDVLFSESDHYGVRAVCIRLLKITGVLTAAAMAVGMVIPGVLTGFFGIGGSELQGSAITLMRLLTLSLPFYVWNSFITNYYKCIKLKKTAGIIALLHAGVIFLPLALIGICIVSDRLDAGCIALGAAYLLAEILTALYTFIYKKLKYPGSDIFLLPKENSGDCLDVTIPAKTEEVDTLTRRLLEFSLEKGVERKLANRMTVAAEEMMQNAIAYGGKNSEWFDVCLTVEPEVLRLRLRDNSVPFDPTTYTFDGNVYEISGIEMVKRIASNITYIRAIDLNNTIIEINRLENKAGVNNQGA